MQKPLALARHPGPSDTKLTKRLDRKVRFQSTASPIPRPHPPPYITATPQPSASPYITATSLTEGPYITATSLTPGVYIPSASPYFPPVSPYIPPASPFIPPTPLTPGVYIPPAPLDSGVCIHPALAAPNLLYDMRSHPSESNPRLSPTVLATPASTPPLPSLALCVGDLPWLFTVRPDASHAPENAVVTVRDVLLAIYFHIRKAVKGSEYDAMSKSRRVEIFETFERRVGSDKVQRANGLRRVDFLGGRFCAQGLVRAQSRDGVWDVVVTE